jgi:hypothetical protein
MDIVVHPVTPLDWVVAVVYWIVITLGALLIALIAIESVRKSPYEDDKPIH